MGFKLTTLSFLLYSALLFSQISISSYDEILSSQKDILYKIEKVDTLLETLTKEEKKDVYLDFSEWLYKNDALENAIPFLQKSLRFIEKTFPNDLKTIQEKTFRLGVFYYKNSDFNNSITTHYRVIGFDEHTILSAKSHTEIARNYKAMGAYQKAFDYYTLAEKKHSDLGNNNGLILNNIGLADLCKKMGKKEYFKIGIDKLLKIEALAKKTSTPRIQFYLYKNLGHLHNETLLYDHDKAFKYYKIAEAISKKEENNFFLAQTYTDLGNLYLKSNFNTALYYFQKALNSNAGDGLNSIIYHNLGYCHLYDGNASYYTPRKNRDSITKAIHYFEKGIEVITQKQVSEIGIYTIKELENATNKQILFEYFSDLAMCYKALFNLNRNNSFIEKAILYFKKADAVFDLLTIENVETNEKIYWREQANSLYEKAIESSYQSADIDSYFYFMEKNKALILQQDLLYYQTKEKLNLPISFVEKEENLKKEIYWLENKLRSNKNDTLKSGLLKKRRALETIQDSIIKVSPKYLKNNLDLPATLTAIQQTLKEGEHVIEYSIFNNEGYILYITKHTVQKEKIGDILRLKKAAVNYLKALSRPFNSKSDSEHYKKIAKELYELLIPDHFSEELSSCNHLIIIPDSFLNTIPFDSLIDKEGQYLLEKTVLSYRFSNSFHQNTSKTSLKNSQISFFAPEVFLNKNLPPLPNSRQEITQISEIIDGAVFHSQAATKNQFIESLKTSNMIHLATHVSTNDTISPWIAFHDKNIYLDELYLTHNNTSLIVLSACQTNTGAIIAGEGVMSISRAFFKTGAKSVISSLWNVNDKSAAVITNDFYQHLNLSQSSAVALRNAKLNYIKNNSLSDASPYYWAPFVLIGQNEVLIATHESHYIRYCIIGSIMVLIILIYMKYNSMRKKKEV